MDSFDFDIPVTKPRSRRRHDEKHTDSSQKTIRPRRATPVDNDDFDDMDIDFADESNELDDHVIRVSNYVAPHIARRDALLSAVARHGSPLYVFDPVLLSERYRRFHSAFSANLDDFAVFYAMKSNPNQHIVETLVAQGCGLDVSSGRELEQALATDAKEIIFSGPGKTDRELELAIENASRVCLLIDSFGELNRVLNLTAESGIKLNAGVRLTTEPDGLWRKFGIPTHRLNEFITLAQSSQWLNLHAIQFHTSWNLTPEKQTRFISELDGVISDLPNEALRSIKHLDIGGGFWPGPGEWLWSETHTLPVLHEAATIECFAREIAAALERSIFPHLACRIWLEPGRWLCNDAMHLMLTVVDRKESELVITDGGTNAIGWERFEQDYFPVINLSRPDISEQSCLILGSLCTPHDLWGRTYCGTDIQVGDVLLVPNQGAYTYGLRQNFIKPYPETALLFERDR